MEVQAERIIPSCENNSDDSINNHPSHQEDSHPDHTEPVVLQDMSFPLALPLPPNKSESLSPPDQSIQPVQLTDPDQPVLPPEVLLSIIQMVLEDDYSMLGNLNRVSHSFKSTKAYI